MTPIKSNQLTTNFVIVIIILPFSVYHKSNNLNSMLIAPVPDRRKRGKKLAANETSMAAFFTFSVGKTKIAWRRSMSNFLVSKDIQFQLYIKYGNCIQLNRTKIYLFFFRHVGFWPQFSVEKHNVSYATDKENLFKIKNFFSWWSVFFILVK